jgi:hypothetical protein
MNQIIGNGLLPLIPRSKTDILVAMPARRRPWYYGVESHPLTQALGDMQLNKETAGMVAGQNPAAAKPSGVGPLVVGRLLTPCYVDVNGRCAVGYKWFSGVHCPETVPH